ncbi:MAG: hypothetical protein RSC08_07880, partial [Oscillospiraceae bacterium]
MTKSPKKFLSLLLALSMLLSMAVLPATAAETATATKPVEMKLNDNVVELNSVQDYTATFQVPTSSISGDVTKWAESLVWTLARTEDQLVQDPAIYPHVYTGDTLEGWQCWDSATKKYGEGIENSPYFYFTDKAGAKVTTTAKAVSTATKGSNTVVTLKFSNNPFFGEIGFTDYNGKGIRNVFNSFDGTYDLTVT